MAYSILDKEGQKGNIIHFLADTNEDYAFIIDTCDPGSTINVLDNPGDEGPNVYMKSPSGEWVHIDGKKSAGDGNGLPVNDAEVIVPDAEYVPTNCNLTVGQMQSNVKVYPTGLVTGTSHYVTNNSLYSGDEQNAHFITFIMPTPTGATQMDISTGSEDVKKENVTADGFLMINLDKLRKNNLDTVTVTFKNGKNKTSFKYNLSQVVLD